MLGAPPGWQLIPTGPWTNPEQQGVGLAQELRRYRTGVGEYSGLHVDPNTDARLWWQTRGMQSAGAEKLADLAELLQDIVPHAAAPERIFSTMGLHQNKTRNRLSAATTIMLTTIKVFYDAQAPRSVPSISLVVPNCLWRVEVVVYHCCSTRHAAFARRRTVGPSNFRPLPTGSSAVPASVSEDLLELPEELLDAEVDLSAGELDCLLCPDADMSAEDELLETSSLSYTELLLSPWDGFDVSATALDPFAEPASQRPERPTDVELVPGKWDIDAVFG
jgi:hypothetical protein